MTEAAISNSDGQLKAIVERIVRLEGDKKAVGSDIKEVYAEAKSSGHNPKALRIIVRKQLQDAKKAAELEAEVDAMMAALGMF